MFVVVFVSLLLCFPLIFLFLLLQALLYSSTVVSSLLSLHTTPGFHWRADRQRKALLSVFQHHVSSPKWVEGEERKGDQSSVASRVISAATLLFHVVWGAQCGNWSCWFQIHIEKLRAELSLFSGDTLLPPSLPLSLYGSLCLSRPVHVGFKKDMNSVRMYVQYVSEWEILRGICGCSSCIHVFVYTHVHVVMYMRSMWPMCTACVQHSEEGNSLRQRASCGYFNCLQAQQTLSLSLTHTHTHTVIHEWISCQNKKKP